MKNKTELWLDSENISYTTGADGLVIAHGNIIIKKDDSVVLDHLVETSGDVRLEQGAKLSAPALTTSGNVYLEQGAKLSAPALATSGNVYLYQGAKLSAPALATSGDVYLYQGAKLSAPALATYIIFNNKFPLFFRRQTINFYNRNFF